MVISPFIPNPLPTHTNTHTHTHTHTHLIFLDAIAPNEIRDKKQALIMHNSTILAILNSSPSDNNYLSIEQCRTECFKSDQ